MAAHFRTPVAYVLAFSVGLETLTSPTSRCFEHAVDWGPESPNDERQVQRMTRGRPAGCVPADAEHPILARPRGFVAQFEIPMGMGLTSRPMPQGRYALNTSSAHAS